MNDLRDKNSIKARTKRGNTLAYLQRNRGKAQYRHAPSAGRAANKVLRPLSRKFGPGVSSLRSQWPQIIGEHWAKLSKPTAVRGKTGAKTLHIIAKGPAAAMLQADSTKILERVNQYLGKGTITKLAIKQGRIQIKPKPTLADTHMHGTLETMGNIADTDDNSLQAALNKLGASVKAKTKKQ